MLIESCALFAVSSLLVIGLQVTGNYVVNAFLFILAETQVCDFCHRNLWICFLKQ